MRVCLNHFWRGSRLLWHFGAVVAAGASIGYAGQTAEPAPKVLHVLATCYPVYVHALNVIEGVKGVELTSLTPPSAGCLHDYQLTPSDAARFSRSDLIVANGAGMEPFMDELRVRAPKAKVVTASEGLALIKEAGSGHPNPHVWLSLARAASQVRAIAAGLAESDPSHADAYRANAERYAARLESLRVAYADRLKGTAGQEIVTFHEAFPYLADELGLIVAAVIEREPGSAPSARELAQTIRMIRERKIRAVFVEPQYPADVAHAIARETGVKVLELDPGVTGPADDADSYVNIVKKNLEVLCEALQP
jgi:zinc transport system substrate-binding protein